MEQFTEQEKHKRKLQNSNSERNFKCSYIKKSLKRTVHRAIRACQEQFSEEGKLEGNIPQSKGSLIETVHSQRKDSKGQSTKQRNLTKTVLTWQRRLKERLKFREEWIKKSEESWKGRILSRSCKLFCL